ncbi:ImmA/IrrE family metallo-endopeptidase [uncultured Megasphaera sp.]|uniref:ImmA/IrrE family metallo-endopeptidase n=1 Tax=uncultured Megasphaera sp. TaxID=165188 RepID=UPI00266BD04F|nr:ImmA/IrrE family metallo-endopeptidase [uncultured Megasphaera sp.]
MDVKKVVQQLIHKYETDDPFRLAREKNIQILFGDLGGKLGNYLKYKRSKYIIIDDARTPEWMLPYVCAHELGHALCTPNDNTQWLKTYTMSVNADQVEHIANEFAVELLLNDMVISDNPETCIYDLGINRGIPKQFIRLKKL